jgi:uncharacterized protein YjbJ (UPF0337 family)
MEAGIVIMNKKQVRGIVRGFAGAIEEQAGKLVGNRELQRRGNARIVSARIEKFAGDATAMINTMVRRD